MVEGKQMFARVLLVSITICVATALATEARAGVPACGSNDTWFTSPLVNLADIKHIVPLGNVNPSSGHTVPVRYTYFYPNGEVELRSPGNVELVGAIYYVEKNQWEFHVRPCAEVTLFLNHIVAIPPGLKDKLNGAPAVDLPGDDGAGNPSTLNIKLINIALSPSELIGWADNISNLDVGVVDKRKPPLQFANPSRYTPNITELLKSASLTGNETAQKAVPIVVPQALYSRCPIDYFADKGPLLQKLKDASGAVAAGATPLCNTHMQDVIGSAQGNWWSTLSATNSFLNDKTAMSLTTWNVDPKVPVFSINGTTPGSIPPGAYSFKVATVPGAKVNRQFSEIKDGDVYCFEDVADMNGGPPLGAVILLRLERYRGASAFNSMRIEFRKGVNKCNAIRLGFSNNAALLFR